MGPEERQRDLESLGKAVELLHQLAFPALQRPDIPEDAPPTMELIVWAAKLYCFSLVSLYREMLRSFLQLLDGGSIPAAFVVARYLFETGAHAYYVHKHVVQFLKADDIPAAWEFLKDVNMGSRYMQEQIAEGAGDYVDYDGPPFPMSREIARVIRCFDEWAGKGRAVTNYSFLSEFSHPNMAAFSHYYKTREGKSGRGLFEFRDPPREPVQGPIELVSVSFTASLHFAAKLLAVVDEEQFASRMKKILADCTKLES